MAFFERIDATRFRATEHVSGAWDVADQHVAPALGLAAHIVEQDRDRRRDDDLVVARLSFDILGTLPVEDVDTKVAVLRPGRTIELVEARISHAGRDAIVLRAWLLDRRDTSRFAGTGLAGIPGPAAMEAVSPTDWWAGGFIAAVEVRRDFVEPGRARFWVRSDEDLVAGEAAGALAHYVRLLDIANGMAVRADPAEVVFPNLDLTAHFFVQPRGEWVGCDTTVSFGTDGIGLTSSILHDETGPVGTLAQILTVRPVGGRGRPEAR